MNLSSESLRWITSDDVLSIDTLSVLGNSNPLCKVQSCPDDLFGFIGNYHSVRNLNYPVALFGKVHIMSYHNYCLTVFCPQAFQKAYDFPACLIIKITCRLITKQNLRLVNKRSCYCGALLLSSRKLRRVMRKPLQMAGRVWLLALYRTAGNAAY